MNWQKSEEDGREFIADETGRVVAEVYRSGSYWQAGYTGIGGAYVSAEAAKAAIDAVMKQEAAKQAQALQSVSDAQVASGRIEIGDPLEARFLEVK